jgi:hypothetical protein
MTAGMFTLRARSAIRDYRSNILENYTSANPVLDRLEADQDGNVSAALQRLGAHDGLVIFYLAQAADLAVSRQAVVSETAKHAEECRLNARKARELAEFSRGRASIHLWTDLQKWSDELEGLAQFYARQSSDLGISRRNKEEAAAWRVAINHFVRQLRDEFKIECNIVGRKEAVVWLVEAALGCTIPGAPEYKDAFRRTRGGVSTRRLVVQSPPHTNC